MSRLRPARKAVPRAQAERAFQESISADDFFCFNSFSPGLQAIAQEFIFQSLKQSIGSSMMQTHDGQRCFYALHSRSSNDCIDCNPSSDFQQSSEDSYPAIPTRDPIASVDSVDSTHGSSSDDKLQSMPGSSSSGQNEGAQALLARSFALVPIDFHPTRAELSKEQIIELLESEQSGQLPGVRLEVFLRSPKGAQSGDLGSQESAQLLLQNLRESSGEILAESTALFEEELGLSVYRVFQVSGPLDEPRLTWIAQLAFVSGAKAQISREEVCSRSRCQTLGSI